MAAPDTRGPAPLTGLVAVVVLGVVVLGGVLLARAGEPTVPGPHGGTPAEAPRADPHSATGSRTPSPAQRASGASRALLELERAVRAENEPAFDRLFADIGPSRSSADDLFVSLRRLPLSTYSLRYIAEDLGAAPAAGQRAGGTVWQADVEVQWGLAGIDRRAVTSEISVTFQRGAGGGRTRIVAMAPADGEHTPVWLLGRLEVERVDRALVISLQPPLTDAVVAQTRRAVRDVEQVLAGWPGGLVVLLPRSTEQLEQVLAAAPGSYDSIAAVTSSADGSSDATAPVRILLNPPVFTGLGPIAGQVVLSHEATHAATGATFRDLPLWLVEGFADYVALAGEPVPVEVAAGQALDRVRRSGPPRKLPDGDDFSTSAHGLGASYEAAWLACRLIAERHGQDRLLRFYRKVSRTGDADAAFASVLRTDVVTFTADWRDYLRELAG